MKTKIIHSWFLLLLICCSCNSWIDIKPSDRLSEDMLFEDREGFLKALNGVYVGLVDRSLYGRDMSAGIIDIMGQYYNLSQNDYSHYISYLYEESDTKATFQNIWEKSYALILNCNIIIEKCDEKKEAVLPGIWYDLVKGEALALRGMLHLDLLRLFGPVYTETSKSEECIPYVINTDTEISLLLSAEKVLELIIEDLQNASNLLKESDPILTEGVRNGSNVSGDNTLNYRQYRMNYYAVKALLARAYLWGHEEGKALIVAEEILGEVQVEGTEIFPFVTLSAATNSTNPDRMFSTEVMFSLYDAYRGAKVNDELFIPTLGSKLCTFAGTLSNGRVTDWYDDQNDYRYRIWATYNNLGQSIIYHRKYEKVENEKFSRMIPLIRLSEIYLIAAECTDNITDATIYLNKVRNSRNCFSVTPTASNLMDYITAEFRREMLGEGQLFFFYKRLGLESIPNGKKNSGNMTMSLNNYVVPLPDSEISERTN